MKRSTTTIKQESSDQSSVPESANNDKPSCWKDHIKEKWLTEDMSGLSKNQQKKLLKKKLWEEKRLEKRKAERQRKKDKRAEMREAGIPLPKRMRTRDMTNITYSNYRIVLDLDFYDMMNYTDLRMVLKQVRQCYADNRKIKEPLQLSVSSFCDRYKALFSTLQPGYVNWTMKLDSSNYMDMFEKDSIVYLTADSENILECLDEDKVYIIGGLVDHNQHKSLCYARAKERGIAHAQLPIGQYVKMNSRKVLTINHVFEILLQYKETNDWKDAFFKVIPKRKGIDEIEDEEQEDKVRLDEK